MMSSVKQTDLDFKISVALPPKTGFLVRWLILFLGYGILS